jgi:hypothetical protein
MRTSSFPFSGVSKFETIADQIDQYLKDSMLITPKHHVCQSARLCWTGTWMRLPQSAYRTFGLGHSTRNKVDAEVNLLLLNLILEDDSQLRSNIRQPELFFFNLDSLVNLILTGCEQIVQEVQKKIA